MKNRANEVSSNYLKEYAFAYIRVIFTISLYLHPFNANKFQIARALDD